MSKKDDGFEDFLMFQMITKKGGGGCLTVILSIISIITVLICLLI